MKVQNNCKYLDSQNYTINSETFINKYDIKNKNFCNYNHFSELSGAIKSKKINSEDFFDANEEVAMWKAVILQALIDLSSKSKKKMNRIYRIQSMIWMNMKNKDFLQVCSNADLDPLYVIEVAEKIKQENPFIQ